MEKNIKTVGSQLQRKARYFIGLLYAFFLVIPRRLNFICRCFGILCSIFITYPSMKMEQTECSETSAYKIQRAGNYPEESIKHSEHGESFKSGIN